MRPSSISYAAMQTGPRGDSLCCVGLSFNGRAQLWVRSATKNHNRFRPRCNGLPPPSPHCRRLSKWGCSFHRPFSLPFNWCHSGLYELSTKSGRPLSRVFDRPLKSTAIWWVSGNFSIPQYIELYCILMWRNKIMNNIIFLVLIVT